MKVRIRAIALAAVVLVAAIVAATSVMLASRTGGPLSGAGGAGVGWPAKVGDRFTWAMPLPDNQTTSDITLESISPDGVTGLDILGVAVSSAGCDVSSISLGYPAPNVPTQDVRGSVIPAGSQPCALQVLVGVARRDLGKSQIGSLRVRYRHAGTSYEDTIPWSLEVTDPGSALRVAARRRG
jgi:hypothetical protein